MTSRGHVPHDYHPFDVWLKDRLEHVHSICRIKLVAVAAARSPTASASSPAQLAVDDTRMKAPPFEGAFKRPTNGTRPTIYRARRTGFFVRAFAFIVDVRTARFTLRVVFALAAFAGRVTLV